VTRGRRSVKVPEEQCAIAGANILALRQRQGWSQARLGELMGWPSTSTVCAAEGHRGDRQRGSTIGEIRQLAAIFDVCPPQLTAQCATCGGHPSAGFACLACGAGTRPGADHRTASAPAQPVPRCHAAARG
jgi:hypothetical protein